MKYIKVIDTAFYEELDNDLTFIVIVSEDEYESLKKDLEEILNNQENYDYVYGVMLNVIREHGAKILEPDLTLEW